MIPKTLASKNPDEAVRFNYALRNSGYQFLGRAEMLVTHMDLFGPVHLRHRIFQHVTKTGFGKEVTARSSWQRCRTQV